MGFKFIRSKVVEEGFCDQPTRNEGNEAKVECANSSLGEAWLWVQTP